MTWWEWLMAPAVIAAGLAVVFGPGLWMLWDYEKNHGGSQRMSEKTTEEVAEEIKEIVREADRWDKGK